MGFIKGTARPFAEGDQSKVWIIFEFAFVHKIAFEKQTDAWRAAMTGHLVFSTLHMNDAVSGITRLIDTQADDDMSEAD